MLSPESKYYHNDYVFVGFWTSTYILHMNDKVGIEEVVVLYEDKWLSVAREFWLAHF